MLFYGRQTCAYLGATLKYRHGDLVGVDHVDDGSPFDFGNVSADQCHDGPYPWCNGEPTCKCGCDAKKDPETSIVFWRESNYGYHSCWDDVYSRASFCGAVCKKKITVQAITSEAIAKTEVDTEAITAVSTEPDTTESIDARDSVTLIVHNDMTCSAHPAIAQTRNTVVERALRRFATSNTNAYSSAELRLSSRTRRTRSESEVTCRIQLT